MEKHGAVNCDPAATAGRFRTPSVAAYREGVLHGGAMRYGLESRLTRADRMWGSGAIDMRSIINKLYYS